MIQRQRCDAFYNASNRTSSERSIHDPMAETFLKRSTMEHSIVTVDHFDQTVTPKYPIKQGVLPICKHSS